ncbi:MAG: elongation factor G [Thiotrichales bacterium]|nr:elongation factor G [Thiotrichales bacterium]
MPAHTTDDIRNVALTGHGGAGKTALAEALLAFAGVIDAPGSITGGTTVCDFDPQEKEHQHSLYPSVVHFDHGSRHVNLVDTPGYPDFLGRALPVLAAVETAAVVVDARQGVQMVTRRMMEAAAARGLARMVVVNKIDAEELDLEALLANLAEVFGRECMPINLPAGGGAKVVDCFFAPGDGPTDFSSVDEAHTRIVDQVVEVDEALMERYLELDEGESLDADRLHDAFERALREGHLVPVCFTSAESGVGIAELANVIEKVMPSPREGNRAPFRNAADESVEVAPDADASAVAHVFKISIDAFVGKLGVFRIHRGTVTRDSQFHIGDARKPVKIGHLFALQGKEHVEIDAGVPGDICAVAKIDEVTYGAVMHESVDDEGLSMTADALPAPMLGLAISAKTRGDEQKLGDSLSKLAAEDPCLGIEHNAVFNETVIRGLGDLHLRMVLEKMKDRYTVEVDTRAPKIAYRETVRKPAEGHHRHKKQTGGAGQFGEVYLRIEPLARGAGFEFIDAVVGGVIPNQFIPAVEKGVRQVLAHGAVAGYPLHDVRVTVYDGKHHSVDSKEVAFVAAGRKAFVDAVNKAAPIVLEPIVDIRVTVPQANMGDIAGDLSSKRGRISGTEAMSAGMVMVSGQAPLAELGSYQSELKSVTGGAGTFSMELSHYDPVPSNIQQQLVAEYKPAADED